MAKKFYVVWQGRQKGIFTDWNQCKAQVDQFAGAKYKSFSTLAEAEQAFRGERASSKKTLGGDTLSKAAPLKKKPAKQGLKTFTASEIKALPADTKLFTDGGCEPNPGEAGSGIAVYRNDVIAELWYGLYNPKGTNNTAELNALNQALKMARAEIDKGRSVVIFCDSQYSIQCITQWAVSWEKKGWKKKGGEIKNLPLIQEMFAMYQLLKNKVQVLHVNGHVGVEGNELADRMSMVAIKTRDSEFRPYDQELDVDAILAMRAG